MEEPVRMMLQEDLFRRCMRGLQTFCHGQVKILVRTLGARPVVYEFIRKNSGSGLKISVHNSTSPYSSFFYLPLFPFRPLP